MNRTVSAAIPDGRLSRRSAIGRLTGAGAAAVIAASGLGMSRDAAHGAPSRVRSSVVTTQEGTTMTDATPTLLVVRSPSCSCMAPSPMPRAGPG